MRKSPLFILSLFKLKILRSSWHEFFNFLSIMGLFVKMIYCTFHQYFLSLMDGKHCCASAPFVLVQTLAKIVQPIDSSAFCNIKWASFSTIICRNKTSIKSGNWRVRSKKKAQSTITCISVLESLWAKSLFQKRSQNFYSQKIPDKLNSPFDGQSVWEQEREESTPQNWHVLLQYQYLVFSYRHFFQAESLKNCCNSNSERSCS